MLSLPITLLILMIAFGSLVAAGVPLLLAISRRAGGDGAGRDPEPDLPGGQQPLVGDPAGRARGRRRLLALLPPPRARGTRRRAETSATALEVAAATSGRAVLISGLTVIVAMAGMFISGDKTFISFAEGTILVVAIAMIASLTVLPALLAWLGDRIEKGRIPFIGRRAAAGRPVALLVGDRRSRHAAALAVDRRRGRRTGGAGGAGAQMNDREHRASTTCPRTSPSSRRTTASGTHSRPRASRGGVAVEADDVRSGDVAAGISLLQRRAETSDNVLKGTEVNYSEDGTVGGGRDPDGRQRKRRRIHAALNDIRDDIDPGDARGGRRRHRQRQRRRRRSRRTSGILADRLPLIFAFVFVLTFLLMLVTFRSIVIPIKAILLNLLSVGAAYGVLVLVFQEGWGESLLGFTSNGGVTIWLPLFLFVILFGLSMDYHVFILSRVREAYQSGMSTTEAVRHGISSTAGTVTSAAFVMVVVFSVFATLSFIDFKADGHRAGRRGADRRDDHPRRAAAGVDEGARRVELVPAEVAGVAAAEARAELPRRSRSRVLERAPPNAAHPEPHRPECFGWLVLTANAYGCASIRSGDRVSPSQPDGEAITPSGLEVKGKLEDFRPKSAEPWKAPPRRT